LTRTYKRPGLSYPVRVLTVESILQRLILPAVMTTVLGCTHAPSFQASLPEDLPVAGKTIAVVGDLQQTTGYVRFLRHRENTAEPQVRLIADLSERVDELAALVIVGDLVYSARSKSDWTHFDELITPFAERLPLLPAVGNHDYPCYLVQFCRTSRMSAGMQRRFPWLEPGRPYAVAADDVLLLFIDSERAIDTQAQWLAAQLRDAADEFSGALVFFHRPPFSNSTERTAHGNVEIERLIVPVLRESPLSAVVFNGHIHGFEHIVHGGVHFVTTAGGGGPRVAMPATERLDLYRGPECRPPGRDTIFRPFNYALLTPSDGQLHVVVRGFCIDDAEVRIIEEFTIEW